MPTALETIELFLKYETIDARTHGDAYDIAKAEIDALKQLIRRSEAELDLFKKMAVDQGFAFMREQQTPEHVVKAHTKRYFTWHKI
jgi:hypothetical protein